MKDLLNKLLPARKKQRGALPKYSAKKRSRLIMAGILGAIAVGAGVYLFITFNPLASDVKSLAETPDIAFSQFHKHIKTGNRKEIIARMSPAFNGGATNKRDVIKALEKLKGTKYKIKRNSSVTKGDTHTFTYELSIDDSSITLANELWKKDIVENKWYLFHEANGLQQIDSLLSGNATTDPKSASAPEKLYDVEKAIPEGANLVSGIKGLSDTYSKVKGTAFYTKLSKFLTDKNVSKAEFALMETSVSSLFGENVVIANYGSSKNYLVVSKVNGSINLLAPVIEKILKLSDKKIAITSTPFGKTSIKSVTSQKKKLFYSFSENLLHISDSGLLLKKSITLAEKNNGASILNNTEVFAFLSDLRNDYLYYLLGAYSQESSPDYFHYGYLEGNSIKSITKAEQNKKANFSQMLASDKSTRFNGTESSFDILPDDIYGFIALTLDLAQTTKTSKKQNLDSFKTVFEEKSGLKATDIFTNKVLFSLLSGSGATITDFFFPVIIAETKPNMAEKALIAIANKNDFKIKVEEGNKYFAYTISPEYDVIVSAINNNLVITLSIEGFSKVIQASTKKYPNIKSNPRWNFFFSDNNSSTLLYSLNIEELFNTFAEIYARSNINPLQNLNVSKRESIDLLNLLGGLKNISGKSQIISGVFHDMGTLSFHDINPTKLNAQTKAYMKKSDLDVQNLFTSLISNNTMNIRPGSSTRLSSGLVQERKIEGFVYKSIKKRDPFAPSYMISQMNYEKEIKGKQEAESLIKEIKQEALQLERNYLKPISFDALLLDLIKKNDSEEYQKIVKYAKLLQSNQRMNMERFEKRKKVIFAYNDLFRALKAKYEEDYLDKNRLPHHGLSSLQLKGVATGALGSKALLVAGGGQGYFIAEGDYISSDFYLVERISDETVELTKKSFNYKLAPTTEQKILSISK